MWGYQLMSFVKCTDQTESLWRWTKFCLGLSINMCKNWCWRKIIWGRNNALYLECNGEVVMDIFEFFWKKYLSFYTPVCYFLICNSRYGWSWYFMLVVERIDMIITVNNAHWMSIMKSFWNFFHNKWLWKWVECQD